jgi:CHAT domain-containing protein
MMAADTRDLDLILGEVAALVDAHQIPAAEGILAELIAKGAWHEANPQQRCRVYLEWGWIHGATQRYETAREALGAAIGIAEGLPRKNLLCEALREAGVVARYEGDFGAADSLLARSERTARDEGMDLELGQALFLRATVAHHRAEFVAASGLLREAMAAAGRCPPDEKSAQLRADISREQAVSARLARDYDRARELLTEARDGYAGLGRRIGVANCERELGAILESLADSTGARLHYFLAFAGYLRAGRRIGAAQVARRLGHIDLVAGADDPAVAVRAARRFAQALRLGRGEPTNAALTTLFQGQLARLQGDLDEAERLLEEAVHWHMGVGEAQDAARGLSQVALEYGLVARDKGDHAAAIRLFREALSPLREADDPGPASLAHFHLAFELIQADEVPEALSHALASFALDEASGRRLRNPGDRRSFYRQHSDTYGLAMHCAARAGDGRAALTVALAARAEALAAFVRAGAHLVPGLQDLVDDIALASAEAKQAPAGPGRAAAARLEELYTQLEDQTSRQMRQAMTGHGTDPDEVIATLPAGGHALLLDVLEEDDTICHRIWISPAGEITVDEVQFSPSVRRFLDSYHHGRENAAWHPQQGELTELGQAVLPPGLAAALGADANPPLVISTGGLLSPVPVAALRINGRHLVEQAELAVVPSMTLWAAVRMRPPRSGRGTLAYVDPQLPSSHREIAALLAALAPVRQVDAEQLHRELADSARYAAVVISAHGTPPGADEALGEGMSGGPRREHPGLAQGLALANGELLTAADLLTCRLPEVLITPSCWSARLTVRAAVEPLGLPTAALAAGARWVLAGAVDIGDSTTASVMSAFYAALQAGATAAGALRSAQVHLLRRRPQAVPGTWAGLTIVGDGFTPLDMPD